MKGPELFSLITISLVCCISLAVLVRPQGANASSAPSQSQNQANADKQRQDTEKQARPDLEKQRQQMEQQGQQQLDQDAVAALEETQKAIKAISASNTSEAMAAIERATGKLNVLLARHPEKGLIPVSEEVIVIDNAPRDTKEITDLSYNAAKAFDDSNFPAARVLLDALRSEIRDRTYHLPLATYPDALKDAARLLDQKKQDEAKTVLLDAVETLVAVDRVTPIPLLLARAGVNGAQVTAQKDKASAQKLLEAARNELLRARLLGYAGKDPEYTALNNDISNLEKQLKGQGEVASMFTSLKDKLASFIKRHSEKKQTGQAQGQQRAQR
jgi:hypothetical protein